jgi:hypothetical protein
MPEEEQRRQMEVWKPLSNNSSEDMTAATGLSVCSHSCMQKGPKFA